MKDDFHRLDRRIARRGLALSQLAIEMSLGTSNDEQSAVSEAGVCLVAGLAYLAGNSSNPEAVRKVYLRLLQDADLASVASQKQGE